MLSAIAGQGYRSRRLLDGRDGGDVASLTVDVTGFTGSNGPCPLSPPPGEPTLDLTEADGRSAVEEVVMRRSRWLSGMFSLLLAMIGVGVVAAPGGASEAGVTGQIVHEAQPAVDLNYEEPATGEWIYDLVAPPVYEPLTATVVAYAPRPSGGPGKVVTSVSTRPDGTFVIPGLTAPVIIQVVPSPEWQTGWLWTEYMATTPGFASHVQQRPPDEASVLPTMDLGMIQLQSALGSGRVLDLDAHQPVAEATVRYDPVESTATAKTAVTSSDGRYAFTGLDFEEYLVKVSAKGYAGGYLGGESLLYTRPGEATTHPMGDLGDILIARR
jgi:hypothetical protein